MQIVRGKAVALSLLILTTTFGSVAMQGYGGADEPHSPIQINGDQELRTNACSCIRNPGASGTATDPFIISDWRITNAAGPAIVIRDISEEHFVIRDNTLDADDGVRLINTGDRGTILRNAINYQDKGIFLKNSATDVTDNILQGTRSTNYWPGVVGIRIDGGAPEIRDNHISKARYGIKATSSSPTIVENELLGNFDSITLRKSTHGVLKDNVVRLAEHWGLTVQDSAHADLIGNEIREGQGGIIVIGASLYMENNTVFNQRTDAVQFKDAHVTMFRNRIIDNWRGAFGSSDSDILAQENVFRNNDKAALQLVRSEGRVIANTVDLNGIGIRLKSSIITMEDNVLRNNTYGFSIPYDSRQSIPLMSGNVVNGVNVDGTQAPSEKRFFYQQTGIVVSDETIDSGHSDGFFGSLAVQGAVIIYDAFNVTITNNTFKENARAVFVYNSSFVSIEGNVFLNNEEGVVTVKSRTFIKDNECDIDIDPPRTVCFEGKAGFVTVRSNTIAHVAVGVRFSLHAGVTTKGIIDDNKITATTQTGVHLEGNRNQNEHHVKATFNHLEANVVGMVLVNFHGTLEGNVVANSTWAGIHLRERTNATFLNNHVILNARGIVDVQSCTPNFTTPCSSGVFVGNVIKGNAKIGVRLDAGGSFEGDVIAENKIGIEIQGRALFTDVNVTGNERVGLDGRGRIGLQGGNFSANGRAGASIEGRLVAEDTNASDNGENGLVIRGRGDLEGVVAFRNDGDGVNARGSARITGGNFSNNSQAGLRLAGQIFSVSDCEASFNSDGVIMTDALIHVDTDLEVNIQPPEIDLQDDDGREQDPLFMHDCDLVANADFAVKASANTFVNATNNFWGNESGPKVDLPVLEGENVVSAHVIASPYWTSRDHDERGFLPRTEAGVTNDVR